MPQGGTEIYAGGGNEADPPKDAGDVRRGTAAAKAV